jgi:CRP-like cAMP-binding protein
MSLLKDDDRELLSSYGEFIPGHPGNTIIKDGETLSEFFVVLSGEMEVRYRQEDGTYQTVAIVGAGATLGEVSMFDPGPATATVVATKFCQIWKIDAANLFQFIQDSPGAGNILLISLVKILSQRLRRLDPNPVGISDVTETAAESDGYSA